MRKTYLFLLLAATLPGCSPAPSEQSAVAVPAAKPVVRAASVSAPELAVKRYLHWYAAHRQEFDATFIDNSEAQDSTKYYAVNIPASEEWLAALGRSGQFSPAYVSSWRTYIRSYADTLRRHPQNDGPPEGFSYDLLMLSQEPDERLSELQAGIFTTQLNGPGKAAVLARGPQHEGWREGLDFQLSKTAAGKWLIDSIEVPDNLTQ